MCEVGKDGERLIDVYPTNAQRLVIYEWIFDNMIKYREILLSTEYLDISYTLFYTPQRNVTSNYPTPLSRSLAKNKTTKDETLIQTFYPASTAHCFRTIIERDIKIDRVTKLRRRKKKASLAAAFKDINTRALEQKR